MRFGILGPLEVTDDAGEPVDVAGDRLCALLAMLVLDAGRPVSRTRLIDGLWGEHPPADAANALQSLVSRLRAALRPATRSGGRTGTDAGPVGRLVEGGPGGYRLAVDPDATDLHRFTALAVAGRRELAAGHAASAQDTLAGALALWRGAPLAGLGHMPFAAAAAARLEEARLAAVEDHAEAALACGGHAGITADLEALAAAHPLRERLCGLLVRALYAAGRQADALAAYQRTQRALAEELGVDPSPALRAVHLAVLRQDRTLLGPATASAESNTRPATNLRAQLTSFVGRDADVARIGALLADNRLVTLVGPGGAGKTRLATEAAARLDPTLVDGVWLVELGPVTDPADLPQAVADALGVRESALLTRREPVPAGPVGALVRSLAGRRLLLLLDNCEHLVDAAARLGDALLAGCPGVRVLATSREPLGITGEVRYPVPPLPVPPEHASAAEALEYPAVRLLVDRGAAVRPGLTVHDGNVAAVLRICRRLDGMPLAIELAAARLRALSVEQVAARLDDRFRLLTSGSRTALPRQQTLRAVVDWSWDLLDQRERALAARLSVFPTGATLHAVERVCAGGGLAGDEVVEVLAALVDKCLVEVDTGGADGPPNQGDRADRAGPDPEEGPRYRMLETVRAYAAERLVEAGEDATLRRAHARYYLDLAETADPKLRGTDQLRWLRRLVADQENLHAALRWAVDTPDPEVALRLAMALAWFWALRGSYTEAGSWARQVSAAIGEVPPPGRLTDHVICRIATAFDVTDPAALTRSVDEGLAILAAAGEPEPRSPAFLTIRMVAALAGGRDHELDTLFDSWLNDPDPWTRAFARTARGGLAINRGRPCGAAEDLRAGLAGAREVGDRWLACQCLTGLAELAGYSGDDAQAVVLLGEAEHLAVELGALAEVAELVLRRAAARLRTGDLAGAQADMVAAREFAHRQGQAHVRAFVLLIEADLARCRGDLDEAERCCAQALADPGQPGVDSPQALAMVRCTRAKVALARGDTQAARDLVLGALSDPMLAMDRPILAAVLEVLAEVTMAGGDPGQAALLLGAAVAVRGTTDRGNAEVAALAGAARRALGEAGYARQHRHGAALGLPAVLDLLGVANAAVTVSAGTPAPPAERTPARSRPPTAGTTPRRG